MNHKINIKAGSISMVKSRRKMNTKNPIPILNKIFPFFTKKKSPFKVPPNVSTHVVQRKVSPNVSTHVVQRKVSPLVSRHFIERKVSPPVSRHVIQRKISPKAPPKVPPKVPRPVSTSTRDKQISPKAQSSENSSVLETHIKSLTQIRGELQKNPKQHDIYMRLIKHINDFIKFMHKQLLLFIKNSNHHELYPLIKKEFESAAVLRLTTYLNKTLLQLSEIDINNIDSFPNEVRTIYNQNCGGWTGPTFCGIAIKAISNGNRVIDKLYQQIEQKIKNNSPNKLLLLDICDFIIEIASKYNHKSGGKKIKTKRKIKKTKK